MRITISLVSTSITLLYISIFPACIKEPAIAETYEADNVYVQFKEGSHWIYHIESARPTQPEQDSLFAQAPAPKSAYQLLYRSTYLQADTLTTMVGIRGDIFYQAYSSTRLPHIFVYSYFSAATPGAVFQYNGQKLLYREFVPVKNIYPYSTALWYTTFTDVKVFEVLTAPADHRLPRVIYWAKNIGIIRKELFNGDTLNLVYSQVQQ